MDFIFIVELNNFWMFFGTLLFITFSWNWAVLYFNIVIPKTKFGYRERTLLCVFVSRSLLLTRPHLQETDWALSSWFQFIDIN